MKAISLELKRGFNEILTFIESSEIQEKFLVDYRRLMEESTEISPEILKENSEKLVWKFNGFTNKKVFEYNTVIISLYGYFENFLETLIQAYIINLQVFIKEFEDMPDVIKSNHTTLSAQLIQNLKLPKYMDITTEDEIVENMASCMKKATFKIKTLAYTYHTSNFRSNSINEFFSKVGIENVSAQILKCYRFKKYLDENEIDNSIAFEVLDDLARRRNEIAHGSVSTILQKGLLKSYVEYMDLYCEALIEVLNKSIYQVRLEKEAGLKNLQKPLHVYNNSIICFSLNNVSLQKGDIIVASDSNGEIRGFGEITSIKVDTEFKEDIHTKDELDVGLQVSFYAKPTFNYHLVLKSELPVTPVTVS